MYAIRSYYASGKYLLPTRYTPEKLSPVWEFLKATLYAPPLGRAKAGLALTEIRADIDRVSPPVRKLRRLSKDSVPESRKDIVITSYSIHYTKLYEELLQAIEYRFARPQVHLLASRHQSKMQRSGSRQCSRHRWQPEGRRRSSSIPDPFQNN